MGDADVSTYSQKNFHQSPIASWTMVLTGRKRSLSPSSTIASTPKYTKHAKNYPNRITRAVPRARGSGIPFPADGPVAQKQQAYNSKDAVGPSALRQTGSAYTANSA